MYGARQRPSHLICGLCPSITDTTFALQFPHMLIIHAVLDHDVSLEDVARPLADFPASASREGPLRRW